MYAYKTYIAKNNKTFMSWLYEKGYTDSFGHPIFPGISTRAPNSRTLWHLTLVSEFCREHPELVKTGKRPRETLLDKIKSKRKGLSITESLRSNPFVWDRISHLYIPESPRELPF